MILKMKLPDIIYKLYRKSTKELSKIKYPKNIDIGFTNYCNLCCEMCPNDKIKKQRGFMTEKLFYSIVDTIVDKFDNKTSLGIGLFGEAILHPKFGNLIEYASNKNVKLKIATNCVKMDEKLMMAIIRSRFVLFEMSFYSLKKERYDKMVGRNNFEITYNNVHKFLSLAEENGFSSKIRLRPLEKYSDEIESYQKEFYTKYPKLNFELPEPKRIENWAGFLDLKSKSNIYTMQACPSVFSRFAIDWDGEIKLCCKSMVADDLSLGYVNENYTVYDVWNSQEYSAVLERFKQLDYSSFPSCLACQDSKKYLQFGDIKKKFFG